MALAAVADAVLHDLPLHSVNGAAGLQVSPGRLATALS